MKKIVFVLCVGLCSVALGVQAKTAKQFETALERQVAQAVLQVKDETHEAPVIPASDRPAYYMTDEAYQTCKSVKICESWVAQQIQKEVHFQVLSATLFSTEDLHHSKLVLKYVTYQEPQEKIFEEDFSGWKEK